MFLLTFLVSLGMIWFAVRMKRAPEQKAVVEEIEKLGGEVMYDYEVDASGNPIDGAVPPGPVWIRNLLGKDFFANVHKARFRLGVNDAALRHLSELTHFHQLSASGTEVTDASLEHLKALTQDENGWTSAKRKSRIPA